MFQWLSRFIWGPEEDCTPPAPKGREPLSPALRRKLWAAHLIAWQREGYKLRPGLLDDIVEAQERVLREGGSSMQAWTAGKVMLDAGRIGVPFRHICICGHVH